MAESEKPADEKDKKQTEEDDEEDSSSKLSLLMNKFASLMGTVVSNEPAENPVLKSFDLKCAAEYMSKCSNVIVMAGAGISTSAGIPDFRSPGTGLYSQLEKYNLPFPEAIFQLDYFRNIDSLERIAGVPPEKIVEAHGTFFASHCLGCRKEYDLEFVKEIIFKDEIPHCTECDGIVKPDIVFFGESLPVRFSECVQTDFGKADFLIIIGTSLKVAPFNRLTNFVDKDCPRLLINLEAAGNATSVWDFGSSSLLFGSSKNRRDVFHQSTCDEGVTELAKLLGWEDDFNKLLESEGVSADNVKKNLSTIPNKTEESANRLAEQMAAASLNDDKKEQ
ncbi:unnamed protein product [Rotaria magnacalcarata]|uniref:Deacetylase sirtuin-type domain-containing protein n=1 Tax=Rotaria magnacalcarata TaxID=392030 RepID=A0A819BFB6_9BILA|nr:unnamed protein product [Rotaria magnacalcarata]CAF3837253.1 unnamed protein product [Rotaria magnacalcarata]CAF3841856.1 unnamed protein product [Rotaria magnacalcarata]CAF4065874.1 unnamed protein product [Rotaria magnacalcarata]CAF4209328.1 unnamed protein product [Rotaria magnacalcarata]